MAEEAVTTLRAELDRFNRAEEAYALLEVFLAVARPWLGRLMLDPDGRQREQEFDLDDEQAVWDYVRLAYNADQATVWSARNRTTYFEASGAGARATYWLPDSLKAAYFDALAAKGWQIPVEWLEAVAKRPKPWWKRGR